MGALLGILLHAIGGFAAGSFYIPLKRVRGWAWASGWLISGVAAWMVVPLVVALLTVPDLFAVLATSFHVEPGAVRWTFLFGLLWGVGGLTFGLSLRYLGVALGTTVALGCCAAFGTLVPPVVEGRLGSTFSGTAGGTVLVGLLVCFLGIAIGGRAGQFRERELAAAPTDDPTAHERSYVKGLIVAVVSGLLSACFAFGLSAGGPLADQALTRGTPPLFQSNVVLVVLLWGGFLTNALYCLIMNVREGSLSDYTDPSRSRTANYGWASLAGTIWYFQFLFYGMGSTFLGERYEFASWSIHMAFIILFGNLWGLYFREWRGTSRRTRRTLGVSLVLLTLSVVLIGVGSHL